MLDRSGTERDKNVPKATVYGGSRRRISSEIYILWIQAGRAFSQGPRKLQFFCLLTYVLCQSITNYSCPLMDRGRKSNTYRKKEVHFLRLRTFVELDFFDIIIPLWLYLIIIVYTACGALLQHQRQMQLLLHGPMQTLLKIKMIRRATEFEFVTTIL